MKTKKIYLPDIVGKGYKAFWNFKGRYRVVKGSRASKKSKTAALWFIYSLMKYPGSNLLVVRKTYRTLKDSCFTDLQWACQRLGVSQHWDFKLSPLEATYKPTGQKILFRGLDDPLKITSITVAAGALCWGWIEEAYEINHEDDFNMLDESIRGELPEGLWKQWTITIRREAMSSSSYWQRREKKWQEECQEKDKDWQKEIEEVYQTMADEISEQIAVFYQKFADKNGMTMAQAKQYLDRTDIEYYSRLAERYCKEAARDMASGSYSQDASKEYFTEQANKEMARYNTAMKISRLEMIKHQINLRIAKAQGKVMSAAEKALSERAMETYTRQAGILGDTVLNNAKNIDTIVHASFHGQNFSERIWGKQQDNMKKVLTKALQDCLVLGKGSAPFVRELAKETGVTTRQAQRLISTELSRVQNQAALDSMVAGGFEEFQVVASPNCCEECRAINGEHFPVPKLATGTNAPPMHPNCRCSIAPFEARDEDDDDFDEASFDEWCDYMEEHEDDPNAMTWEEWKDKEKRIVAQKSRRR